MTVVLIYILKTVNVKHHNRVFVVGHYGGSLLCLIEGIHIGASKDALWLPVYDILYILPFL